METIWRNQRIRIFIMAIKKDIATVHGLLVTDAYHRVEHVEIIEKTKIKFRLRSYVTTDFPHFADVEYSSHYELAGENPISQAYAHLKSLPEFADAVDC